MSTIYNRTADTNDAKQYASGLHVEITDPTASYPYIDDMPLYDGDIESAGTQLIDGEYPATGWVNDDADDAVDGTVTIAGGRATFTPTTESPA